MEKDNILIAISFDDLYKNCIYSSIAHAVFVLKEPYFSYTQSWDEYNYSFNYGSTRGTLSFYFDQHIVVGAARNEQSIRRNLYPNFDASELFEKASDFVRLMAVKDPLEYLYDEIDEVVKPVASIGFWLEESDLHTQDEAKEFIDNGGEYIFVISKRFSELKSFWTDEYQLSQSELDLVDYIYSCFISHASIKAKDVKKIINKKCIGYNECIDSLKEINIDIC